MNEPIFRAEQQNLIYEYVLINTPNYLCDKDTHTPRKGLAAFSQTTDARHSFSTLYTSEWLRIFFITWIYYF